MSQILDTVVEQIQVVVTEEQNGVKTADPLATFFLFSLTRNQVTYVVGIYQALYHGNPVSKASFCVIIVP